MLSELDTTGELDACEVMDAIPVADDVAEIVRVNVPLDEAVFEIDCVPERVFVTLAVDVGEAVCETD